MFDEIKYRLMVHNEKKHYSNLLKQQDKNSDKILKVEPKVDAFSYAYKMYNGYLTSKMPNFHMMEYILKKILPSNKIKILSLGSGTGDWEITLLEKFPTQIDCELIDINSELLDVAKKYAEKHQLDIITKTADINKIQLSPDTYDFIIVRSSLHHFIELEHIFEQINCALKSDGEFLVIGEVIGQNGEKLYPQTKEMAQKIFDILPPKFRYNNYTKKTDKIIPDDDFSKNSFESIRSEDITPLLEHYFQTTEHVTFDAFLSLLLDFRYGPNYDLKNDLDKSLVDMIVNLDIHLISNNILKPVCLFGIYNKK